MDPSEPGPAIPPPTAPQAAPGWYPVDAHSQRYWDGHRWTEQLAPLRSPGMSVSDQQNYAMALHLSSLVASLAGPLIMWLIKREESPLIDHHGKESVNFHLTLLIACLVSFVLIFVIIGIFMLLALALFYFVFTILAAIAAHRGELYRFPAIIRFIK